MQQWMEFPGGPAVKDLALSLLWLSFNPWPYACCGCHQKKKKKKKNVIMKIKYALEGINSRLDHRLD